SNSVSIRERLDGLINTLEGEGESILPRLNQLTSSLQSISKFGQGIDSLNERLRSVHIELKDILSEAEDLSVRFHPDPNRVQEIESRLDVLYRLQKKHRLTDVKDLISLVEDLRVRLSEMDSISEVLMAKKTQADSLGKKLLAAAKSLSTARKKVVPVLEKTIRSMLSDVSLPNAVFSVELDT
ncbi:MAG: hypothetical protein ACKO7B_19220, partial [Flavobacteriales bacterium]